MASGGEASSRTVTTREASGSIAAGAGAAAASSSSSPAPGIGPKELMALCEQCYAELDVGKTTVDSHTEDFLRRNRLIGPGSGAASQADEDTATFVKQVVYGTVRYKRLIMVLLTAFYNRHSGQILRGDRNKYAVFMYITLFRIPDLSFPQYKRLVLAENPQKMVHFLSFIFNTSSGAAGDAGRAAGGYSELVYSEWLKLYDREFVEALIQSVLLHLEDVENLLERLEQIVFMNKKKQEQAASGYMANAANTNTVVRPFNLSQPKTKLLPPSEPAIPKYKAQPAPQFAAPPPPPEPKHPPIVVRPFRLRVLERPSSFAQLKEDIEEERKRECEYIAHRPKPVPDFSAAHAAMPIKLNTASILREDALYKRKQAEEARFLRAYEEELRDQSDFLAWQSRVRGEDEAERAAEIERRKQDARAAEELAIAARHESRMRNRKLASDIREDVDAMLSSKHEEEERALREREGQTRRMREDRVKVKEAIGRLERGRKERAEALVEEKANNARLIAAQRASEQKERQDVIRKLRAMISVKNTKATVRFDPTSTHGIGLLEEMSLAELKERLRIERRRAKEEEAHSRAEILKRKNDKSDKLLSKLQNISRIRDLAAAQAQQRQAARPSALQAGRELAVAERERGVLSLVERLEHKRDARDAEVVRLAHEEKETQFENKRLAATKGAVEEKKFLELRAAQERDTKRRQATALEEATIYERTKDRQQRIIIRNMNDSARDRKERMAQYDLRVSRAREANSVLQDSELANKRSYIQREWQRRKEKTGTIGATTNAAVAARARTTM